MPFMHLSFLQRVSFGDPENFSGGGGWGFRRLFEFFGGPGGRGPRHNLFKFLFVNFIM